MYRVAASLNSSARRAGSGAHQMGSRLPWITQHWAAITQDSRMYFKIAGMTKAIFIEHFKYCAAATVRCPIDAANLDEERAKTELIKAREQQHQQPPPQRDSLDEASMKVQQRHGENAGQVIDPNQALLKEAATRQSSGQILHGTACRLSGTPQQVPARSPQPPTTEQNIRTEINSILTPRTAGTGSTLIGLQGSKQAGNNLTLKGWPLTQKSFMQSPQQFQQFQFLTLQQQQQLLLHAQQNISSSVSDVDTRGLRNMVLGQDGKTNSDGDIIPNFGSPEQSGGSRNDIDMLRKGRILNTEIGAHNVSIISSRRGFQSILPVSGYRNPQSSSLKAIATWHPPWGRMFSSSSASSDSNQNTSDSSSESSQNMKRPPPVTQLVNIDPSELEELDTYLADVQLLENQYENPLVPSADPVLGPFDLSKAGKTFVSSGIGLVLRNCNRGYCIRSSFSKENVRICRRLNQINFKEALLCDLDDCDPQRCRSCSYQAFHDFVLQTLVDQKVDPDILLKLAEDVCDLIYNMKDLTDERKIPTHPAILSAQGKAALNQKIYRLVCKEWKNGTDYGKRQVAKEIAMSMLYLDPPDDWNARAAKFPILDIIRQTNLQHTKKKTKKKTSSTQTATSSVLLINGLRAEEGMKFIGHNRHVPNHCHDEPVVKHFLPQPPGGSSGSTPAAGSSTELPYSFENVMGATNAAYPLYQVGAVEAFIAAGKFEDLEMDTLFPMPSEPVPTPDYSDPNAPWSVERVKIRQRMVPPSLR